MIINRVNKITRVNRKPTKTWQMFSIHNRILITVLIHKSFNTRSRLVHVNIYPTIILLGDLLTNYKQTVISLNINIITAVISTIEKEPFKTPRPFLQAHALNKMLHLSLTRIIRQTRFDT